MRKIILSFATLFTISLAVAQETESYGFAQGDIAIGGGIMFQSDKDGSTKTTSFGIIPMVDYFFTDNISGGIAIGYESTKVKTANISQDVNMFLGEIHGRYYLTPASRFSLFGQLALGYGSTDLGSSKINAMSVVLNPAINYFISENFALMGSLGGLEYTSAKPDYSGAEASTSFGFELKIASIDLALIYKF